MYVHSPLSLCSISVNGLAFLLFHSLLRLGQLVNSLAFLVLLMHTCIHGLPRGG